MSESTTTDLEALTLIECMVHALVDDIAAVGITVRHVSPQESVLDVRTAPADTGKLIGKQGRTARSLRTIVNGMSRRLNHTYSINIMQ